MIKKSLGFAASIGLTALMTLGGQAADLGGKVLKVGSDTTYPPMETVDETTGEIVGFDVDVVDAICEKINCRAQFVTTAWDGIFAALVQGEFDMVASGVSITEERDKIVDFTDPYLVMSQSIMVRVDDENVTLDDVKAGMKLGAQTGTTNAQLAESLVGRANMNVYDTGAAAILALSNGDIDGVVVDGVSATAYEQEFAGELVPAINGLESDPLGLVFPEGSELVDAFNEGLAEIKADGTLDALINEYFGKE
ncbi:basic amino acid ABC transporter substrate-binding protein [Maritalea mediterranea]|uniref:basic amino acid ABC transporter substrate-binding protein n=1 Tax=Maritalea mediterranea TaxID=2909667 RepID=UPI003F706C6C